MMGIERFPEAKKDLRRAILHKDRGFAVRLTPNGEVQDMLKVANLDQDCLAASIRTRAKDSFWSKENTLNNVLRFPIPNRQSRSPKKLRFAQ